MKASIKNWLSPGKSKYRRGGLLAACLLACLSGFTQINLVPNPSLENLVQCPDYFGEIYYAQGWDSLRAGGGTAPGGLSTSLYNVCANGGLYGGDIGVPINSYASDYQWPHTGNGYANVNMFENISNPQRDYHDYMQAKLLTGLTAGKTYCVTFYVNLDMECQYALDQIGAYLDDGSVTAPGGKVAINAIPQVSSPKGVYLTDTLNWVPVHGSFVAKGTEQYISIGNFKSRDSTHYITFNAGAEGQISAYNIDDISVIEINTKAYAGRDTTIACGDSAFIGIHDIGAYYNWYFLNSGESGALTQLDSGSTAGIYVSPNATTTYIEKQTQCSVVSYDTVVVKVLPPPLLVVSQSASYIIHKGVVDTLKVLGNNTATYSWSPATGLNTTTGKIVFATPTVSTTYTVTATGKGGCSTTASVEVSVNTTGINGLKALNEIKIYPNPSTESSTLTYQLLQPQPATVSVADITGRVLQTYALPASQKGELILDATQYPQGLYFCTLMVQGKPQQVLKWVVTK